MPVPIQFERLTFEQGWIQAGSSYAKVNGFREPSEVWRLPGAQDTLAAFGPYTAKETDTTGAVAKIASGIVAKDSSGNVLRVVHDITAGAVHVLNANGTLGAALKSSISTTTPVAFVVYNEKILCFDGATQPFQIVISSQAVSDIGLTRPDATAGGGITTALTGGGSGNLTGIVKYYIAEITGTTPNIVESALSVAFGQINTGDGDQVTVTFPNNAEFNSKTFYIYRTYGGREAPNFLAEIAVGASGGSFVDNIVDDDLGDLPRLHGDQPPAGITAAAVVNDVLYGLAASDLYFSDPGEEESWWTATDGNIISVDRGDGDIGTALFVDPDGLVIFKEHHILKLLGSSPADYQLVSVVSADATVPSVGTANINTVTGVPGGAFFYHDQGFYVYSLGRVSSVTAPIASFLQQGNDYDVSTSGAVMYDPRLQVVYAAAKENTGVSISGFMLVFDASSGAWLGAGARVSRQITAFMYDPEQSLMFGFEHLDSGQDEYSCFTIIEGATNVVDLNTIGTAATKGSVGEFRLPEFYGSSVFSEKRILWAEIDAQVQTTNGTLTLGVSANSGSFSNETDTYVDGRTKYRFNLGKYGWMRSLSLRVRFDYAIHIFRVLVAYQELPSRSI